MIRPRIVDSDGAIWPITGHRCRVCRMPLDAAVDDSVHPGCRPAQPVRDQAEAQLIDHLGRHLGAQVLHPNPHDPNKVIGARNG